MKLSVMHYHIKNPDNVQYDTQQYCYIANDMDDLRVVAYVTFLAKKILHIYPTLVAQRLPTWTTPHAKPSGLELRYG